MSEKPSRLNPTPSYLLLGLLGLPVAIHLHMPLWWMVAVEVTLLWTLSNVCDFVNDRADRDRTLTR